MHGRISPRYVGKVDQDLATARANLRTHTKEFRTRLDSGEPPEVVFMHFAQTMLRETDAFHLSIMFAATVLTLAEQEREHVREHEAREDLEFRLTEFVLSVRTVGTTPVFDQVHVKCRGGRFVVPIEEEPTTAHFRQVALDHLRECAA